MHKRSSLSNALLAPLMQQVEQMAKQFGVAEDVSYTCETAAHFWLLHVLARWEKFLASVRQKETPECVKVSGASAGTGSDSEYLLICLSNAILY